YCSTFRRGGYTFEAATHFYPLLGNPATHTGRLLEEIGCRTEWVRMDPVDTFHLPDGSRFDVPADFDTCLAKLQAEFPHEREALDSFFAAVRECYAHGLLVYFRGRPLDRSPALAPYRDLTLREALDRWFRDEKLKLILAADCPHWGSRPERVSFIFDSMLRLSYFLGNYFPKGSSQAFVDDLALRLEEKGGHVLTSALVRRIRVQDGQAEGVELEVLRGPLARRRFHVAAGAVISNADLLLTLEKLVGTEHVDPDWLAGVRGLRLTFPCWLTHIGLRGVAPETLAAAQGYYWDSWEMDRVGIDALRFKLFVPTLYDPELAPPDGQVLIVQKVLEMDYGAVTDWPAHKLEIEKFIREQLEQVLTGILDHVAVWTSASAHTSWRFSLNRAGAMLGWEMSPEQLGENRPALESPIRNLFFVGHWTRPGGGVTPVLVSAQQAARAVIGAEPAQALRSREVA
ncbi:MAG TPA: NAD(P)/FAD-dependent oxidoreductase, partial [Thermoanaerobaculia bacterium]|nr:NAD(P)/FAD-dependent oxidoreductase [Thermoanaerobaculia bacterium]